MAFAGLRGTGDWGTGERPKNFREAILWLNPNGTAPLTALLAKAASDSVDDPEFNWWEEKLDPLRLQINYTTGFATTDTALTVVANGLRCVPGMVFQVEKAEAVVYNNEHILVSSVTSDSVVVFKRGASGTTAAPILNNAYLTFIGSSYEEGAPKPSISSRNPTKSLNYAQVFETGMGVTWTASKTRARTGDIWKNDKKRKMFDHSSSMEFAFIFGVPYEDTTGTKPKWFTGGLRYFITTNTTIFTTTPTEDTFLEAVYKVWNYTSGAGDQRIVLAGNGALNSLNKLARNSASTRVNFDGTIKLYGMNLQRWVLPQGELAVKTHPLFNVHGRYTNSMMVLDPTSLKYRHLIDTKFVDDIQLPGTAAHEAMWYTQCGLEVQHECTNAYIGNFVV